MADLCTDNRFELIEKYKQKLIKETNIESAPDEMKVLDNILFRFWQMDWLDKLEQTAQQWISCSNCARNADNGGLYPDGRTRCPIQEHYALLKDGYCHLAEPWKGEQE